MCILRLRSIMMTKNKRLQVQLRVVFIMNEHFNNYNPWWPREDIAFCPSCPCCFADHPRIHTDFSLIPRCDNPWKDTDFAFSIWAVLHHGIGQYCLCMLVALIDIFVIKLCSYDLKDHTSFYIHRRLIPLKALSNGWYHPRFI
jgi:hypothetical protein